MCPHHKSRPKSFFRSLVVVAMALLTGGCGGKNEAVNPSAEKAVPASGQAEGAKTPGTKTPAKAAVAKTATAKTKQKAEAKTATKSAEATKPATASEARKAIDLRNFPKLNAGQSYHEASNRLSYQSKARLASALAYHRRELQQMGWKEVPKPEGDSLPASLAVEVFRKDGFFLRLMVNSRGATSSIDMNCLGNVDLESLPVYPGATRHKSSQPSHSMSITTVNIAKAADYCHSAMLERGWKPYQPIGISPLPYESNGSRVVAFVQNGVRCYLHILADPRFENGKTAISYYPIGVMERDVPMVAAATSVKFNNDRCRLQYEAKEAVGKVIDFYRLQAALLGWKEHADKSSVRDGFGRLVFGTDKEMGLMIDIKTGKQQLTAVDLALVRLSDTAQTDATHAVEADNAETKTAETKTEAKSLAEIAPGKVPDTVQSTTGPPAKSKQSDTAANASKRPARQPETVVQKKTRPKPVANAEIVKSVAARHLPFPRDARKVEFDSTFNDISYVSSSSIPALTAFYRSRMPQQGWREEESEASIEDDSVELTFQKGKVEVTVEIDKGRKGTEVELDCKGITWEGTNDPALLVKSGISQPKSLIFLQQELPRPKDATKLEFENAECKFLSSLKVRDAVVFFTRGLRAKGWKQGRKPFVGDNLGSLSFKRNNVALDFTIFRNRQAPGSRITVRYKNPQEAPDATVLAGTPVAGSVNSSGPVRTAARPDSKSAKSSSAEIAPTKSKRSEARVAETKPETKSEPKPEPKLPDPLAGKGLAANTEKVETEAVVSFDGKKQTLKYAVAYQTKEFDDLKTVVIFSAKPISPETVKKQLNKEFVPVFDIVGARARTYLKLSLSPDYLSANCYVERASINIGTNKFRSTAGTAKGRVRGRVSLLEPHDFFDKPVEFQASFDVALIAAGAKPKTLPLSATGGLAVNDENDVPVPEKTNGVYREGSQYRKTLHGSSRHAVDKIVAFYRGVLPTRGWAENKPAAKIDARSARLEFSGPNGGLTVTLKRNGSSTKLDVGYSDTAKAREDGMAPPVGKSKIILGNAYKGTVTITVAGKSYRLNPGQGARDPDKASMVVLPPGKCKVVIKVPGFSAKTENLVLPANATWGIIIVPNGRHMSRRMY